MDLYSVLEKCAMDEGADFFGVADLAPAREAILAQGGEALAGYPLAISLGIKLLDPLVDQLPERHKRAVAVSYRMHCYDVINQRLDLMASKLSGVIQRSGYKAFPVPSSMRADDEKICAVFSHKMAAHLAGLGWIGKSCLLVTPEAGPRVRWITILTDAPLKAGTPMAVRCGDCRECADVCPVKAFTGRNFVETEPREARYDARRCEKYLKGLETSTGYAVCGMCLYICPFGKKVEK
ncbi:MAG TPA: 4Fe-4S double cluster binding domain-containing protein [Methanocella sp.]|uniref:4Fe-4S double cluster binding domain-containing protein n=1 Tax=Methanocella sp. TaxID=2052833 RepID=UPI002CDAAE66|nr:4Fe-4S double cluster binding domain-containing protein [Methanocella sp.]HTY91484.1 4Fe-4S double cluster binding domain-containing protein [Methanocella sp.]